MPAHQPRRTFARSFVVTFAAVALPACSSPQVYGPNPPEPTAPPEEVTVPPVASAAPTHQPTSDPVTSPDVVASAKAKQGQSWIIQKSGDKCTAEYADSGACPAGDSCNPPPPMPYDCPKVVTHFPVTVTQAPDTKKCSITYTEYHNRPCPPKVHCNPPPPSQETIDAPCPH